MIFALPRCTACALSVGWLLPSMTSFGRAALIAVQFFGWLLVQDRIHTRSVLLRKHIITVAEAGCPLCTARCETADHMVFWCPFARTFWSSFGCPMEDGASVRSLHHVLLAPAVPGRFASMFLLLCCSWLWKHPNGIVFNGDVPSVTRLRSLCHEDDVLWRHQLPASARDDVDGWLDCLVVRSG